MPSRRMIGRTARAANISRDVRLKVATEIRKRGNVEKEDRQMACC